MMAMSEVWKDVKGYEGYYQVSNKGRVRSVDRIIKMGKITGKVKGKILKIQNDGHGYGQVSLSREGKYKSYKVHRLVAEHFVPNPNNLKHVNHIDGDKTNNNADNLEWVTQKENNQHAWDNDLNRNTEKQRKAAREWCKVNREKMVAGLKRVKIKCLNNGKIYNSIKEASEDLGISHQAISRVSLGQRKHTHGYRFIRLEEDE